MPSSPPPRQPSSDPLLTREQGDEVLRYWLAALRLEEALSVRPQARRATHAVSLPRLEQPTPGQDYFKLPLDAALRRVAGKADAAEARIRR